MKIKYGISLALLLFLGLLSSCGKEAVKDQGESLPSETAVAHEAVDTEMDLSKSPFRHLNNGGINDPTGLPYNVDAITGATMTVEGPAMVSSIPLSIREFENRTEGMARGLYTDSKGSYLYEGMDLYYLLHDMVDGDNGIIMTDKAYRVLLKNSNRQDIASLTLAEIEKAHESKRPILLAYGMGSADGDEAAPFVFDAKAEGEHSLGYVESLDNDDGCIRLVYDNDSFGNGSYDSFKNVAYVYVCEESEPGFKHTASSSDSFGSPSYTDYIIGFRGEGLGYEIDLTVKDLEQLVVYGPDGIPDNEGLGYRDHYSLANNAYWYVNEYEGLHFYNLLQYLGMASYEEMGSKAARTTLVSFLAADGYPASETFSVDTLSYPDAFGFYTKNASDNGDGKYVPTNADLVATGYPVMLAYGVNNYPYTITKSDKDYLSGLSNGGGPCRIVFGKTQYNHANGSNQVQYLKDVIVGQDVYYNTHKYTEEKALQKLAKEQISIKVVSEDNKIISDMSLSVGELEDLIYGSEVSPAVKKELMVKDLYETGDASDIYEGFSLEYLLMNYVALPGTNGSVTFDNEKDRLTVSLDRLFARGYNDHSHRGGMSSVLAFAKNGSPMVRETSDPGYVDAILLKPFSETDPASYKVDNAGGPLKVIIPSDRTDASDCMSLEGITSIEVTLVPDAYAHLADPFDSYKDSEIRFYGEGLAEERTYKLSELESMQTVAKTMDFSILDKAGNLLEKRFRGIPVYSLLSDIGLMSNVGEIKVYAADGFSASYSLSELKKEYENFLNGDKPYVSALLAFGCGSLSEEPMTGLPLVADKESDGFDEAFLNDGGPVRLILPQAEKDMVNAGRCMKQVTAIEVTANEVDGWGHAMSDVYGEFSESTLTIKVVNETSEWSQDFTVAELEEMKDIIFRGNYTVLDLGECEGLDLWKLLKKVCGHLPGIDSPISVTAYAVDDYKNDLLSLVYMDGLTKGIENEAGDVLPVIICYAIGGYPLVDEASHPGYTGLVGNSDGPLRVVVENSQGGSVKYLNKLVVTIPGTEELN